MLGKVMYCKGQNIFRKYEEQIVPVFPVYCDRTPYYPIVVRYSLTLHKLMGQTLPHVT